MISFASQMSITGKYGQSVNFQTNKPNYMLLAKYEPLAIRSHNWTSFSPEDRGKSLIKSYSNELEADIADLEKNGVSEAARDSYKAKYESFFHRWLCAKAGTFSMAITGGSGFNVRKHEKANRSEERHYELFVEWRRRAKKAIIRKAQPPKTFLSELEQKKNEVEKLMKSQQLMKDINVILRKAKGKECTEDIMKLGVSKTLAEEAQKPDCFGIIGFPTYQLQNNLANIKRIQERIKLLEAKEKVRVAVSAEEYPFEGGIVTVNYEENRIQIAHDTKPAPEVIGNLKKNGFRWSPFFKAWQRILTNAAIYETCRIAGVQIPSLKVA